MKQLRHKLVFLLSLCLLVPMVHGEAASLERERYIILYEGTHDEFLSSIEEEYIHERYDIISAVAVSLTEEQVHLFNQMNNIKSITPDQVMKIESQTADWGISTTKSDVAHQQGKTGKGVKIAILDTGIDSNHPDLRVVGGACFNASTSSTSSCGNGYLDVNGHGTHVAGIIGALNNHFGTVGVAYGSDIYAVKILDDGGNGLSSTVLKGMEWAIQQKVDIINLSLSSADSDPALKTMMDYAYSKGVLVVAAAGNEGNTAGTGDTSEYPGRYDSVISVAAVTKSEQRASFSATGPSVEFAAPGDRIYSTAPEGKYVLMSGTSMAAPYVTGMLAVYKEQFPMSSNREIRQMLQQNAKDLGIVGKDPKFGYGLVQANTAEKTESLPIKLSTEKGTAIFTIDSFPEGVSSYDVYRDGELIEKDISSNTWMDYVVKGTYNYSFHNSQGETQVVAKINEPFFRDLSPIDWFMDELVYLNKSGIIYGYEGDLMKPKQDLTRAEAVVMLGRAIGLDGTKRETVFKDVHPDSSISGYIQSAYEQGILSGYPDETFRPDRYVNRGEMAILLSNAYKLTSSPKSFFTDVPTRVTGNQSIYNLAHHQITVGYPDGTFRPYDTINRASFAVFVARAENDMFKE